MRKFLIFRLLLVVVFLTLLMVAAPAEPARAERGIALSPADGAIGARITVTGVDFNKSTATTDKYAAIYFSSQEATTLDDIDIDVIFYEVVEEGVWLDYDGSFSTSFNVPSQLTDGKATRDVTRGTYYVYVCHYQSTIPAIVSPRIRAVATFNVTMGQIELSSSSGTVDAMVEITGVNFASNRELTVKYDGSTIPINSGSRQTSSIGDFSSIIRIPDSAAGSHTITVVVSGDEAVASFIVEPEIITNPISGEAGTTVVVSGTGFSKLKKVTIWFYNTVVATATTSIRGSFYANFDVPGFQAGLYNVDAEEGAYIAKAKFTIIVPTPEPTPMPPPEPSASVSISETIGNVGQGLVMGGAGFQSSATVTIKYDNELLTAVTTDDKGVFAAAFTVPPSEHGNHTIAASDGTRASELVFTVESTPPPVPALLLPEIGNKVKSPLYFRWQDVVDPSPPVTYTIQVATSTSFSATSLILEQKGLIDTEYSIHEEERTRLGMGDNTYYWRVRAIDGASNEGEWANPGVFYFVTSGALPIWAIVVIAIIVVLFLLALGYFIRVKTSVRQ